MINQKNNDAFTPFQVLLEYKYETEVEKLPEVVSDLVRNKKAQLNGLSANENFPYSSPLCLAVNMENIQVMKILLNAQADFLERDTYGIF